MDELLPAILPKLKKPKKEGIVVRLGSYSSLLFDTQQ